MPVSPVVKLLTKAGPVEQWPDNKAASEERKMNEMQKYTILILLKI